LSAILPSGYTRAKLAAAFGRERWDGGCSGSRHIK
jgi:hypothetical protein